MTPAWNQGNYPEPYDSLCEAEDLQGNPIDVWVSPNPRSSPLHQAPIRNPHQGLPAGLLLRDPPLPRARADSGVDPILDLNRWLVDNEGYSIPGIRESGVRDDGCNINPYKVVQYAERKGVNLRYLGRHKGADLDSKNHLCGLGPQVSWPGRSAACDAAATCSEYWARATSRLFAAEKPSAVERIARTASTRGKWCPRATQRA